MPFSTARSSRSMKKGLPIFSPYKTGRILRCSLSSSSSISSGWTATTSPLFRWWREKLLSQLIPSGNPVLSYSDHIEEKGKDFFDVAVSKGLEGMMAKKANSTYRLNERTDDWLKVKVN